ncbi:hypothetical protein [Lacisediminihabitans profunda]|uniref:Uncharacterized protein n=1 Tax=Lacisediminihabitans profunda TaxID=2594790 RepID=A0A5C8ULN9_9MICO|nr:hypothetical protein [Lacisediminihabitans profunda]TXN29255.1 hypothetical protein FVP33_13825 [Lacisediminihabitans profunda]
MSESVVAAETRLMHALEQQLVALDHVARVVAAARTGLPAARQCGIWRGEAHSRYVDAVDASARQLEAAERQLTTAAMHTRRAIASLAGRVG